MPTSANSPSGEASVRRDPEVHALALRTLRLVVQVEMLLAELVDHTDRLARVLSVEDK